MVISASTCCTLFLGIFELVFICYLASKIWYLVISREFGVGENNQSIFMTRRMWVLIGVQAVLIVNTKGERVNGFLINFRWRGSF